MFDDFDLGPQCEEFFDDTFLDDDGWSWFFDFEDEQNYF